jgi:hypothetical protein
MITSNDQELRTIANEGNERRRELVDYRIINVSCLPWTGILDQRHGVIYLVCELKICKDGTIESSYRVVNARGATKLGQMGADANEGKILEGLTVSRAFAQRYTDLSAVGFAWVLVGAIIFDKDRKNVHTGYLLNSKVDDDFRNWLVERHDDLFSQPAPHENKEKLIGFDPFDSNHMDLLQEEAINFFDGEHYLANRSVFTFLPFQEPLAQAVCSKIDSKRLYGLDQIIQQLLCSFAGSGKSHMSSYFFARYVDSHTQIALFTTPVVKTMEDIKVAIRDYYYGVEFEVFDKERILREGDNLITTIKELQQRGILVVVLLSVQYLRRGEEMENVEVNDLDVDDKQERDLASKLSFLKEANIGMWIRDERHMQYDGPVTKIVLEHITPRILLDLTATPYRELQAGKYKYDEITSMTLAEAQRLVIANDPSMRGFPLLKIEAFNVDNSVVSEITKHCGYSVEELADPRKWNAVDEQGNFIYPNQYLEFFRRAYCGSYLMGEYVLTEDRVNNPLELVADRELINSHSDRVGLVVLPEGGNGFDAEIRITRLCSLLNNDPIQQRANNYYISTYDKCWNRAAIKTIMNQLLKKHHRVIILTHRMFTTGVNIPHLGHIVLLDTIGSINEFEQLLSRLNREYVWDDSIRKTRKTITKMFVIGAGTELKAHVYHMAYAANEVNPEITIDEYYRCLPLTIHGKTLSRESIDIVVLEGAYRELTNRLRDGRYSTGLVQQYSTAMDNIASSDYHDMGNDAGEISITITKKNGAKVRVPREKPSPTNDEDNKERFGKDGANRATVLALMLNEINHIGFLMGSDIISDAFETNQAETFFGYDNVTMALLALQDPKLLEDVEFGYREYCDRIKDLPFNEQTDILFQNKEYKRSAGVVYVKQDLAEELCGRVSKNLTDKHNKVVTNNDEFVITIVNALSGTIPFQIRKMYPKARIVCAEYFPHYIDHLQEMGFEVVDLDMKVDNLTVEYMNSKLQKRIQKDGIACVLGNPPYQDPNNDGTKIFRDFMNITVDVFPPSVPIAYITPNTWLSYGDEVLSKILHERGISFIDTRSQYIKDTYFPGVGSTFCWFVLGQKTEDPTTLITYEGESQYNVNTLGFIPTENTAAKVRVQPTPSTLSILNKYFNFTGECFGGGFTTAGGIGTRTQHSKVPTSKLCVPCYCSTAEDKNLDYIEVKTKHHHQRKVLFVSSYLHNPSVQRARYCNQPISTMNNIAYWPVGSDEEGKVIEEFCNSDFLKFILFCLTSKRDVPIPIINSIKVPMALQSSSIQEIYGLSDDEMKTITVTIHDEIKNEN